MAIELELFLTCKDRQYVYNFIENIKLAQIIGNRRIFEDIELSNLQKLMIEFTNLSYNNRHKIQNVCKDLNISKKKEECKIKSVWLIGSFNKQIQNDFITVERLRILKEYNQSHGKSYLIFFGDFSCKYSHSLISKDSKLRNDKIIIELDDINQNGINLPYINAITCNPWLNFLFPEQEQIQKTQEFRIKNKFDINKNLIINITADTKQELIYKRLEAFNCYCNNLSKNERI